MAGSARDHMARPLKEHLDGVGVPGGDPKPRAGGHSVNDSHWGAAGAQHTTGSSGKSLPGACRVPEYVVNRWWEGILHNQSALRLKLRLLRMPGVVVTIVQ